MDNWMFAFEGLQELIQEHREEILDRFMAQLFERKPVTDKIGEVGSSQQVPTQSQEQREQSVTVDDFVLDLEPKKTGNEELDSWEEPKTLADQMEADAEVKPDLDDLGQLAVYIQEHLDIESQLEELSHQSMSLGERLKDLGERKIPELFHKLNLEDLKLQNGIKVSVAKFYAGSISEENQEKAFDWLREQGFDDMIKNELKLIFGKGEDEDCETLARALGEQGYNYTNKKSVHSQTLKAFIRERTETGDPEFSSVHNLFNVHIGDKTKIKIPKGGLTNGKR